MMPGNTLSTVPITSTFLPPRNVPNASLLVDVEEGGVGISDPSQGVQYQVWTAFIDNQVAGNVYISAPNTPPTLILTVPGISELSLTFDQNMHPFLAYVQNGQSKFYWFDPTLPGFTVTTLESGSTAPRCSLDDKRAFQINAGNSDILLFYVNSDTLRMRMQRDRYTIIYTLATGLGVHFKGNGVTQVSMAANLRFQIEMQAAFYVN